MAKRFERLTHHGELKSGKLELANPAWFRGMLALYDDAKVTITVERKRSRKSKEQLGYLFGVVYPYLAEHTGHTVEEIDAIMKARFLKKKVTWRGTEMAVLNTKAELTMNEMAEYLTNVIQEAAELGIEIPPPLSELEQVRRTVL